MSIQPFSSVSDFSSELSIGRRATGTSMTAFLDPKPGKTNVFQGPMDMKQLFYVRPVGVGSDDMDKFKAKKNVKFEINLEVKPEELDFAASCGRFDDFLLAGVFARKGELMPSKASLINTVDALKPLYVSGKFLHEGGMSATTGNKYADTIKLRLVGDWQPWVEKVVMRAPKGKATWASVDYCEWKPRDPKTSPLAPADTRFFLWVRKDEASGKDVYTDKVAMGNGLVRMVGPEDCKPGCLVTPIFSMANVYVSDGFGVTVNARALYIKPRVEPETTATAFTAETMPMLGGAMMDETMA